MKIIGTGRAVPKHTVSNAMLSEFLDTSDEWIVPRTGIHTRQIITDETLQELATAAACQALEDSGLKPEDIDFILCSNVASNYVTPAMSAFIQEATGRKCPFFDINGACAGFIYALDVADAYMQSGRAESVRKSPRHTLAGPKRDGVRHIASRIAPRGFCQCRPRR